MFTIGVRHLNHKRYAGDSVLVANMEGKPTGTLIQNSKGKREGF